MKKYCLQVYTGMTLLELLLVCCLISILVSVAYPNYRQFVFKGYRSEAMADLTLLQLHMEKGYRDDEGYPELIQSGHCALCSSPTNRYQFEVSFAQSEYVLKAIPQPESGQTQDRCGVLTLSSTGKRQSVKDGEEVNGCW